MTLEQYFHKIINQPRIVEIKEPSMFERSKAYFQSVKDAWSSLYTWDVELKNEHKEEDSWAFYIYSSEFQGEDEYFPERRSHIGGITYDTTWIDIVDDILDKLGEHFGYDIKSQVYYSVTCPTNDYPFAGRTRLLNDGVLQQLLLAFPEVYERSKNFDEPKNVFE